MPLLKQAASASDRKAELPLLFAPATAKRSGRTPVIFHSESSDGAASLSRSAVGYVQRSSRQQSFHRDPPPYRSVPLSRDGRACTASVCRSHSQSSVPCKATEVPHRTKSTPFLATNGGPSVASARGRASARPAQAKSRATVSSAAAVMSLPFPQSVSLQFDSLPELSNHDLQVPSPAPAERRTVAMRASRTDGNINALSSHYSSRDSINSSHNGHSDNKCPRSSSLPRTAPPSRAPTCGVPSRNRPLSHPASLTSNSQWLLSRTSPSPSQTSLYHQVKQSSSESLSSCSSGLSDAGHGSSYFHGWSQPVKSGAQSNYRWPPHQLQVHLGTTPAPAPSPSSTPSPSRPLAHLPTDGLRTQNGIRVLEKKLELFVDILLSQDRFAQVPLGIG